MDSEEEFLVQLRKPDNTLDILLGKIEVQKIFFTKLISSYKEILPENQPNAVYGNFFSKLEDP